MEYSNVNGNKGYLILGNSEGEALDIFLSFPPTNLLLKVNLLESGLLNEAENLSKYGLKHPLQWDARISFKSNVSFLLIKIRKTFISRH